MKNEELLNLARFDNLHSTTPRPTTWEAIVEEIRSNAHAEATARYRTLCQQATEAEDEALKARLTALKHAQPAFIPSVALEGGRSAEHITAYTDHLMVDIDGIAPELMAHTLATVRHDAHGKLIHTTLSGRGIRIICPVDVAVSKANFGDVWQLVNDHYARLTGLPVDAQCKNATRMSVLCHDAEALYRPDAPPLPVADLLRAKQEKRRQGKRSVGRPITARRAAPVVRQMLEDDGIAYESGHHNDYICRCLYLMNRFGVNEADAQAWALHEFADYDATHHSVAATVRSCYARTAEHKRESLAAAEKRLGLSSAGKNGVGRPSNKATIEEIEEFISSWGEFRFNRLINQLEYRVFPALPTTPCPPTTPPFGHPSSREEGSLNSVPTDTPTVTELSSSGEVALPRLTGEPGGGWYPQGEVVAKEKWLCMSDQAEHSLWRAMQHAGLDVEVSRIYTLLHSDFVPDYHPLQEYLNALPPWDGVTDYIGQVARHVRCKDTTPEEFDFYFRRWFVGILAGALSEEVVNNVILVLLGPQGIFKSSFMDHLLPPELHRYYTVKANSDRMSKDDAFALTENLLINLEEIDSMKRNELNQLKALCTTKHINDRPAYGRNKIRLPHVASFCGTGNNLQFLTDDTGNRRWLPFEVERIDNPWNTVLPYAGMYAQAKHLLDHGFCYWFTQPEVDALNERNRRFEVPNPARELILMHYRKPTELEKAKYVTASQIVARWGGSVRLSAVQVGRALRELRFEQVLTHNARFWLVVERTTSEMEGVLPESATDATLATDVS